MPAPRSPKPPARRLRLSPVAGRLAICRAPEGTDTSWASGDLTLVARSAGEAMPVTIICEESAVPQSVEHDGGWRAIRFVGVFGFGEVGVLASVLSALAEARLPVLTVSTFETDYVLIKATRFERVRQVLEEAGHQFVDEEAAK